MGERLKGKCKYCGKEYTVGYMNRHLSSCKERQKALESEKKGKECGYFLLCITAKYDRDYWIFLEIRDTATLKVLDQFLRDIWLECCGHLSAFEIGGVSYEAVPAEDDFWGEPAKSMNYKLKAVLEKGMTFEYQYDFGSTTELSITVVNHRIGRQTNQVFTILSRNNPPVFQCSECGKTPAVAICTECAWEGKGFLCEDCAKTHECGEEMQLPVCNSPRMGVCAYEGSDLFPDQFVPDVPTPKAKEK